MYRGRNSPLKSYLIPTKSFASQIYFLAEEENTKVKFRLSARKYPAHLFKSNQRTFVNYDVTIWNVRIMHRMSLERMRTMISSSNLARPDDEHYIVEAAFEFIIDLFTLTRWNLGKKYLSKKIFDIM
jgi:hypothetical protein